MNEKNYRYRIEADVKKLPKRHVWISYGLNPEDARHNFLADFPDAEIKSVEWAGCDDVFGYEILIDEDELKSQLGNLRQQFEEEGRDDFDEALFNLEDIKEEIAKGCLKGLGFLTEEEAYNTGYQLMLMLRHELCYDTWKTYDTDEQRSDEVFRDCVYVNTFETIGGERVG
jgi:hypothetical protein